MLKILPLTIARAPLGHLTAAAKATQTHPIPMKHKH